MSKPGLTEENLGELGVGEQKGERSKGDLEDVVYLNICFERYQKFLPYFIHTVPNLVPSNINF